MSNDLTHEAARESLEALALDALDASEREAVMAHVANCETCQAELAALESTVGELAFAAAPLAMRPGQRDRIRARLMARAAADRGVVGASSSRSASAPNAASHAEPVRLPRSTDVTPIRAVTPVRRGLSGSAWMAMAASVIAVLGVGAFLQARSERDTLRESLRTAAVESGARSVALDSLRASVEDRDRMIANLIGPQVAVMSLASAGPESPTGRMFWDQTHDAWTFVAHHVPAPKAGRTYQLWLVTPTSKISAGTFAPTASGEVVVRAKYALPKDSLAAVAVTDEPSSGSAQPTTQPFLVATSGK